MSWNPIWENIFRGHEWGQYPPVELIRFIAQNFYSVLDRSQVKILEIGCGTGSNIWFLSREGFDVYGFDGSQTAVSKAKKRMQTEGLRAQLQVGDAISLNELYPQSYFDSIIDIGCLQHNRIAAVDSILSQVPDLLKPHGKVFSMMLAAGSYGDGLGVEIEPGTFQEAPEGPLFNRGQGHFFSLKEIQQLFSCLANTRIEYSKFTINNQKHQYKTWITEASKHS